MRYIDFNSLVVELASVSAVENLGRIAAIDNGGLKVTGLCRHGRVGDQLSVAAGPNRSIAGEIVAMDREFAHVATYQNVDGLSIGNQVLLLSGNEIRPHESWVGRVVDAFGSPLDGSLLAEGPVAVPLKRRPPDAASRNRIGGRLKTGLAVFNTLLPIARGQRLGIFSGSGVGKTTLLGRLAGDVETDIVVMALIGERGRELRDFIDNVLGPAGMARTVLVVATSDQSPLTKRRAAYTAMTIAEYFRDRGMQILLIFDSLTRFAEAHREIALAAGEKPGVNAFPPSTASLISALAERSGPGSGDDGDITAVFSVLVAGSDMEEPVADMARGVLDGHVILDRKIAERGRFPAIDVRRSVSRSLPNVASAAENQLLSRTRRILGTYFDAETLIQTGLYTSGSDRGIDEAIKHWPAIDNYCAENSAGGIELDFQTLENLLPD